MRTLLLSTLLLTITLTATGRAAAFDCIGLSPSQSFKAADVVFEGEVIRTTRTRDGVVYTFRVLKLLKGAADREVNIVSGYSSCDASFQADAVYRVYARRYEGKLTSGACSGNTLLKEKDKR